jgi:hypothetical protein
MTWIMAFLPPSARFRIRDPSSLGLFLLPSSLARLTPKVRITLDEQHFSIHNERF